MSQACKLLHAHLRPKQQGLAVVKLGGHTDCLVIQFGEVWPMQRLDHSASLAADPVDKGAVLFAPQLAGTRAPDAQRGCLAPACSKRVLSKSSSNKPGFDSALPSCDSPQQQARHRYQTACMQCRVSPWRAAGHVSAELGLGQDGGVAVRSRVVGRARHVMMLRRWG